MHSFEHIDACLPITALKALEVKDARFIFQGQGIYCFLIDEETGELLAELKTFKRNNIHGFLVLSQISQDAEKQHLQLIAWGGQSVRVIDLLYDGSSEAGHSRVSLSAASAEFLAPDWILAGCCSQIENEERCAYLVTAHNALVSLHVINGEPSKYAKSVHLRQLATGVKSILYSAHTVQISPLHILIAAGTVFGEIIVWSCFIDNPKSVNSNATSSIHHFFTGHEGSIFGVEISSVIPNLTNGRPGRLLVSCSDDRTIRIWDISDCEHASVRDPSAYSTDGFELRSTGFGAERELGSEPCVTKAFGHVARIWGVHFMPAHQDRVRVVSRGEDAQCLLWDLTWGQGCSGTLEYQLREVSSFHYHAGKHIFSLSMCSNDDGIVVYTGGNDGAIKTFKIDGNEAAMNKGPNTRGKKAKRDVPLKAFDFVSPDCFIGTSVNGEVQFGWVGGRNLPGLGMQPQVNKEIVCVEEDLRGYSIISSLPHKGLALIGNSRGLIRLYNHQSKSLTEAAQTDQRPLALVALYEADSDDSIYFVASYVSCGRANLFASTLQGDSEPRVRNIPLCILYPSEVQSASLACAGTVLILGFKNGSLAVYRLPREGEDFGEALRPVTSIRLIHGDDGINHIKPFSSEVTDEGDFIEYILTCGRDGNYCVHELVANSADLLQLETVHRSSPAVNLNIEGAYFDEKSDDLMLYGFRGMYFVLWNESTQSEVSSFFCGGARRQWAFHPSTENAGDGLFLWYQGGFNSRRIHAASSRPLRAGGHGREIKTMEAFNAVSNEGKTIFATGAEDTTVRIFEPIQPGKQHLWGAFKSLRVLRKHGAGLQQVGWSENKQFLFTSAAYEEFFAWRVRWIPRFGVGTLFVGAAPKEDQHSEVRVTSFDLLEVEEGGQYGFLIVMAFSNSVIKIFHYSPFVDNGRFTLLAKTTYMSNCLTQAKFIHEGASMGLITASTDGHFTFWNLTPILDPIYTLTSSSISLTRHLEATATTSTTIPCEARYQIHSNSIKDLELAAVSETMSLAVAGGDDNAVTLSLLHTVFADPETANTRVHTITIPDAHAASVTAVKILSQDDADNRNTDLRIATSGNDHRVKVWSVSVDAARDGVDAISVSNLVNHYSSVADISSLDVIRDVDAPRLLVCGVGMEMVQCEQPLL